MRKAELSRLAVTLGLRVEGDETVDELVSAIMFVTESAEAGRINLGR